MLTYYQAVELMNSLPLLSSSVPDNETAPAGNDHTANDNILEMPEAWYIYKRPAEANGEYFID